MSRLSQMIETEQRRLGKTERQIAAEFGWSQQTFNTWKSGVVPRHRVFAPLARFLRITEDDLAMLVKEASASTGSTKLPDLGSPIIGREHDGLIVFDEPIGFAKPQTAGCYVVRIGGRNSWVNPRLRPIDGNEVVVRSGADGRVGVWPLKLGDGEEAHVIVLSERV
ncbi:transcriptional regulator with XRE-family HTH domain [Sinorhizobium fredii]